MSLIVEIGNADAMAESYIGVTEADAYFGSLGNAVWAALTLEGKEQALRRATNYMGQQYRLKWQGLRVSSTQALDWPRWNVTVADLAYYNTILPTVIPTPVKRANAELAVLASVSELNPVKLQQIISKTVGPIKVEYDPTSPQGNRYTAIHDMLAPYLSGSAASGNIKLVRC
jgi:hypothetical protein